MSGPNQYHFRAATFADLDLLKRWQESAHVGRWWGSEDPFAEEELVDPRVYRWIVSLEQRSFAYMQDYAVHGWGQHHFDYLPEGSRGIDQYIGETQMIGKGHGTGFIRQRMTELFSRRVPVVATDPHPENHRAIAVYQKVGFKIAGTVQQTKWGLVFPWLHALIAASIFAVRRFESVTAVMLQDRPMAALRKLNCPADRSPNGSKGRWVQRIDATHAWNRSAGVS
ncbi:MAG: GNAT family N-acetyltransferase [Cypionkella sp.]|uniref:GNAT family N-acetyltransferase n=1 Tax=Cypionkella sp. TaxID=2811411 RepID=UPI002ABA7AF1|nr:GNAT family N-acetyltransferase [Cypionkella sp.]MDZ4313084.1 GNAT family N-acetyltransferase [Cypionkella sp.]